MPKFWLMEPPPSPTTDRYELTLKSIQVVASGALMFRDLNKEDALLDISKLVYDALADPRDDD